MNVTAKGAHTTVDGPVLWVEIDRPDALNAVDFSVMEGLEAAIDTMREDRELRVLVLTGAGTRAFVSGGDLRAFADLVTEADAERMARRMHDILASLEALDAWTLASINADAYGGGCETALAFDFRIAASTARLGFTQARFNLPPGWGGLTRLVELVGRQRALAWLASTAVLDAPAALDAGLVDRVVEPAGLQEATREWALTLARHERSLIAALKHGARRAHELPRAAALEAELPAFCAQWAGDEHHRRVRAFLNRTK